MSTNPQATIAQALPQGTVGYRLTLDSAENCLKAQVNPITGRHLITEQQAAHLQRMLDNVRSANPEMRPHELIQCFAPKAVQYLRRTTTAETQESLMQKFKAEVQEHYANHGKLKYQPKETPSDQRIAGGNFAGRSRLPIAATGALLVLHNEFEKLRDQYGLTSELIGMACIGPRTKEPLSKEDIITAVSALGQGKAVGSPFRYIAKEPDQFFNKLEAFSANQGRPIHISAEERASFADSIRAALEEFQARKGERTR